MFLVRTTPSAPNPLPVLGKGGQHRRNCRPVRGASADMMEPHHTGRVNQHVAPLLGRVSARYPRKPPSERLTAVDSHGGEPPEMPEPGRVHVVRPVEPPFGVHEQRPDQPGPVQILAGLFPSLEGHDERLDLEPIQFLARLLQLQQMSAARQSEQMPVEHQQQPPATVVFEAMLPIVGVAQREGHRGAADAPCHVPDP